MKYPITLAFDEENDPPKDALIDCRINKFMQLSKIVKRSALHHLDPRSD